MKMKTTVSTTGRGIIALATLVLVGGTGVVWAQKATKPVSQQITRVVVPRGADVLKGLRGVEIVVEDLSDDAEKRGLTRDRIQSAIELSLRRNRVPVLTKDERQAKPGRPYLYVKVSVGDYTFSINVELHEDVRLARAPSTLVAGATTWGTFMFGAAGATGGDFILKSVEEEVDTFCLDYRKANPK